MKRKNRKDVAGVAPRGVDRSHVLMAAVEALETRCLFTNFGFGVTGTFNTGADPYQAAEFNLGTDKAAFFAAFADSPVPSNDPGTMTGNVGGKPSDTKANDNAWVVGMLAKPTLKLTFSDNIHWCESDGGKSFNWSIMDGSPPSACPAPGESGHPVRYADGAAKMSFDDFGGVTDDLVLGGLRRSWSNVNYADGRPGGKVSSFSIDSQVFIQQLYKDATYGYAFLGVVLSSGQAFVMLDLGDGSTSTAISTKSYQFGDMLIRQNAGDFTYTVTQADGTELTFADFSSHWGAPQRGALIRQGRPGGVTTEVASWTASGLPETIESTRPGAGSAASVVERMTYTYATGSDQITRAQLSRGDGTTMVAVRTVDYDYYDGTTSEGSAGDLKSVTVRDGDAAAPVRETQYYRWYKAGEANGYAGGLKLWLSGDSYLRAVQGLGTVGTASDTALKAYADNYFEYDASKRVTKEIAQGAGCSCVGNGGQGEYDFEYAPTNAGTGRNEWKYKTIERLPDHTPSNPDDNDQNIVYTNEYGDPVLKIFQDTAANQQYLTYYRYDDQGQVTLVANPSAVTGYSETLPDLVGYDDTTGRATYLSDDSGLVSVNEYYTETTAPAPGLVGNLCATYVQRGDDVSTRQETESWTYTDGGVVGDGVYYIASDTLYAGADGTQPQTTSYQYTWYTDAGSNATAAMKTRQTTLPTVAITKNGPGTADVTMEYYDTRGNVVWTKDADGYVNYYERDPATGAVTKQVIDVDPSTVSSPALAGPARGSGLPTALALTTLMKVDGQGRTTWEQDPNGNVTYTVYDDTTADGDPIETRTYVGWNSTTHRPTGPVLVSRHNPALNYDESLSFSYSDAAGLPVDANGVPTGAESLSSAYTTIQSLSRSYTNDSGQVLNTDAYYDLSGVTYSTSTSLGTEGTNFARTSYGYDARGRRDRVQSPTGTVTRYAYDGRGNVTEMWIGTDDQDDDPSNGTIYWSPANASDAEFNLVEVQSGNYGADGNLTKQVQYPHDGTSDRVTMSYYDWRDRLFASKTGVQGTGSDNTTGLTQYYQYNNQDQIVAQETYAGDTAAISDGNADGVPDAPASTLRRSHVETFYDEQGRAYRTSTFSVLPAPVDTTAAGTISASALTTDYYYDHRGSVIKVSSPGGLVTKYAYDGAGRNTAVYQSDGGGDAAWSDAGDVDGDVVLRQAEYAYDANDNVILKTVRERFHNAYWDGPLGTPQGATGPTGPFADPRPAARVSYEAFYYDAANRLTADVNFGTNGGTLDGTGAGADLDADNDGTVDRPSSVLARSDTVLVTSYAYDAGGRLQDVTDPRGIVTRTTYDLLGRTKQTVAAYTDGTPSDADDQTTQYTYDGSSHVLTMKAVLPAGKFQTTAYVYGASQAYGSAVDSNDLLAYVQYPDPTTGDPATDVFETYTYDALGEKATYSDRNGTTHGYSYDVLGRLTADTITNLGLGVDNAVQQIGYTYDSAGRAQDFTSYGAAKTLSSLTRSGSTATATKSIHGYAVGDWVEVSGADQPEYNGVFQVTAVTLNTFSFTVSGSPATTATGTITVRKVVNQVTREYNGLGQLTAEYQSHAGPTDTSSTSTTPVVRYAYSEMGGGVNHSRLLTITYPNGRVLHFEYGAVTGLVSSAANDSISRLTYVADDNGSGGVGTHIEQYSYLGLDTVVRRETQAFSFAEYSYHGDGGDDYGLDRFGRVSAMSYDLGDGDGPFVNYAYAYDRNGNVLYKKDAKISSFSELYHSNGVGADAAYDSLNRLTDFRRGTLSASTSGGPLDTVSTAGATNSWDLDASGNWVSPDREYNAQNQATSVDGFTMTYDGNGNLTSPPSGDSSESYVYDAWNRLIGVSSNPGYHYAYDAMGRQLTGDSDLYYNAQWQVIEERQGGEAQVQYVWSPDGSDRMTERDDNADADSSNGLERRVFAAQDANGNVVALVDLSAGYAQVGERFAYDPYGSVITLNPDGTPLTSGDPYLWTYLFQGQRYDWNLNLYDFRHRAYDPTLGRFLQQDPTGYADGANLYMAMRDNPITYIDPMGTTSAGAFGGGGTGGGGAVSTDSSGDDGPAYVDMLTGTSGSGSRPNGSGGSWGGMGGNNMQLSGWNIPWTGVTGRNGGTYYWGPGGGLYVPPSTSGGTPSNFGQWKNVTALSPAERQRLKAFTCVLTKLGLISPSDAQRLNALTPIVYLGDGPKGVWGQTFSSRIILRRHGAFDSDRQGPATLYHESFHYYANPFSNFWYNWMEFFNEDSHSRPARKGDRIERFVFNPANAKKLKAAFQQCNCSK